MHLPGLFVKCIKGHSGYYSCERCEIKGNWEQGMYFVETNGTIREDSKFSSFEYEHHQIQRSPLIDYGISCVKQFPLDSICTWFALVSLKEFYYL